MTHTIIKMKRTYMLMMLIVGQCGLNNKKNHGFSIEITKFMEQALFLHLKLPLN